VPEGRESVVSVSVSVPVIASKIVNEIGVVEQEKADLEKVKASPFEDTRGELEVPKEDGKERVIKVNFTVSVVVSAAPLADGRAEI
jgi:hypothetical protein